MSYKQYIFGTEIKKTAMKSIREINAENPGNFAMVSTEFGYPVYVAPLKNLEIQVTDNKEEAEKWSYADTLSVLKLKSHQKATGLQLTFEKI